MIDEKKKKKRRLLWLLLIFFLLAGLGGVIVAGITNHESPRNSEKKVIPEVDLEQKKIEAKQIMSDVFCYCAVEDISHYQEIAKQQAQESGHARQVGGMECLNGYYDEIQDIAYVSGIFTREMFYDIPPYDYRKSFSYYYRDFYLKNRIHRFDFYSLNKPEFYKQPVVFRIYKPEIYNHSYEPLIKKGYRYIKYTNINRCPGYYDTEQTEKRMVMIDRPTNFDDYGKIPFEEYAEIVNIDLSKVVFIDIK